VSGDYKFLIDNEKYLRSQNSDMSCGLSIGVSVLLEDCEEGKTEGRVVSRMSSP